VAAALGAVEAAGLQAAMIDGTVTKPAAPARPLMTVRRETEYTPLGSAMARVLLRSWPSIRGCPTKSDSITQIVGIGPSDVKIADPSGLLIVRVR
jgi:hypothetical protein